LNNPASAGVLKIKICSFTGCAVNPLLYQISVVRMHSLKYELQRLTRFDRVK
jgi:hypothetical protein